MTPASDPALVNATELEEVDRCDHGDESKDDGDSDHGEISLLSPQ
jgi:hypothetical protein